MTKTKIPSSTTELLGEIEREWSVLIHVVDRLTPKQMITPDAGGWSPKDNLAHLAEWLKILMAYHMDKQPAHRVLAVAPEVTRDWDMDTINQVLFERNQFRPVGEILDELKQTYQEVITRLESISFDELMKPCHADDPEKLSLLALILGNTSGHFAEHRSTMEKSLK
jgi:hypothetical protein